MTNFKCKHCIDGKYNEIGEKIYFCELFSEWRNYTLGNCIGNCETQKSFLDENEMEAKEE